MDKGAKIWVAGRDTLLGRALMELLFQQGYRNILGLEEPELDFEDGKQVEEFFSAQMPEYVFMTAGKSGGIAANQKFPADLMRSNLLAACYIFDAARRHGVHKLLYVASSCIYPKFGRQPLAPEFLLNGELEPTSQSYALAKLSGLQLCQAYRRQYRMPFICAIPGDVFGPFYEQDPEDLHVIPALIQKMHQARITGEGAVTLWGSGDPRRDFIFSSDVADAAAFLMENYNGLEPVNIGSGEDYSVKEIACLIQQVVGFKGRLEFDWNKPDGDPLKLLDTRCLNRMGWFPKIPIREGLRHTYDFFLKDVPSPIGI